MLRMIKKNNGFTLVELMIALVISSVVMTAIYRTFNHQHKSYIAQNEVSSMQQNVRVGIHYVENMVRLAGYNPTGMSPTPTITAANNNSITFEIDDGTGAIDTYTYSYNGANETLDMTLNGGGALAIAEDIEALGFSYAYDDNGDAQPDTYTDISGNECIIWAVPNGGNWFNLDTNTDGIIDILDSPNPALNNNETIIGTNTGTNAIEERILAVRISLLAKTGRGDEGYYNNFTYIVSNQKISPGTDADPINDDCRMRLQTSIVKCRNMGLFL